jgi:hypothetical protein
MITFLEALLLSLAWLFILLSNCRPWHFIEAYKLSLRFLKCFALAETLRRKDLLVNNIIRFIDMFSVSAS